MQKTRNFAVLINNTSYSGNFINQLLKQDSIKGFEELAPKKGGLFSRAEIERFMDEEERHDIKILTRNTDQSLKTMSSGEQKKALLSHLMSENNDFLVLVNPFDNLDVATQSQLKDELCAIGTRKTLIQLASRVEDILPVMTEFFKLDGDVLVPYLSEASFWEANRQNSIQFKGAIPPPLEPINLEHPELVNFEGVSVSFDGKQVLDRISWRIKKGDFWQLVGPNGSGKTTLLSMITGDSHKGYGKNLSLFGQKKGSGESVWDLKKKIGYFTPAMTDKFGGYHTLEHMVISGLHDSIGLYVLPTQTEKLLAREWLQLLNLYDKRDYLFRELSAGDKRLVMTARAMIKHPPLLILDEPTAGLDDASAALFVALVNKIAQESHTAIIFVSHRMEAGLHPQFNYVLEMRPNGSVGTVIQK
ncbi:ATP-binding cassette domain-containing protein [Flagellimonas alvinocaridis]|uniref:ABC transporter ATP-binding protein n=1 Tax=Flagellimonas alvinocaridis TaxID=2530200 RepID=UPI003C7974A8